MAYKCDICHYDIEKWQSWHANGERLVHFACEVGKKPARVAQAHYHSGEKARITLGDEGISPKKKEDSQPPLGKGERGNHRTKRKHIKKPDGKAHHFPIPIDPKDFTEENYEV